jgi:hypothetical protein
MSLAILLLNLLPGFIAPIPGISDKIKSIIASITGSANAILSSGAISTPNVQTILAAWTGVLTILRSDPNLPQDKLGLVDELQKLVAAALLEDQKAMLLVDWSKFITPTATV